MNEPLIAQKSPFLVKTDAGTYYWCACGRSKSQPFCDGSHAGTGIAPQEVEVPQSKMVAWCGCKHSKRGAFCDGSHSAL